MVLIGAPARTIALITHLLRRDLLGNPYSAQRIDMRLNFPVYSLLDSTLVGGYARELGGPLDRRLIGSDGGDRSRPEGQVLGGRVSA